MAATGRREEMTASGGFARVVVEHTAEAFGLNETAIALTHGRGWRDELVPDALVVALGVVVGRVVGEGSIERPDPSGVGSPSH